LLFNSIPRVEIKLSNADITNIVFTSFFSFSLFFGSSLYNLYSQTSWKICCEKKNAAIKYGCGLQKEILTSWISFKFGERQHAILLSSEIDDNESRAAQRTVECDIPMLRMEIERGKCGRLCELGIVLDKESEVPDGIGKMM
jgi:hypothetical protein